MTLIEATAQYPTRGWSGNAAGHGGLHGFGAEPV
jgi:hypothetical protein